MIFTLRPGLRRFGLLLFAGWAAFWLTMQDERLTMPLVERLLDALSQALVVATVVWACCRWMPASSFHFLSVPTGWVIFLAGLLGYGRDYGALRDAGYPSNEANLGAAVGVNGFLVMLGIGLWIYAARPKAPERKNAQD